MREGRRLEVLVSCLRLKDRREKNHHQRDLDGTGPLKALQSAQVSQCACLIYFMLKMPSSPSSVCGGGRGEVDLIRNSTIGFLSCHSISNTQVIDADGGVWGSLREKKRAMQFFCFLFFFLVLGLELRAFTLNHSASPFCNGYFRDRVSRVI
jgi:hypothetical protein